MSKSKIKIAEEILSHFCCGFCGKWWTIGDAPKKRKMWFCPWCGKKTDFTK
ncbi:hypothetical protein KGQ27_02925 [Patescibacteria group bacterium]|nr:hypothetical protein [Patescibacteria group bacterium]MDE1946822.1 hypothetical protein [Patescibacteria group bacterium]MDE2011192.1 hypothetical protein [Patescibacteria group bacterium]MDE2233862.1 hypothetical protein [Patescibacteria group bacterium]